MVVQEGVAGGCDGVGVGDGVGGDISDISDGVDTGGDGVSLPWELACFQTSSPTGLRYCHCMGLR